MEGWEAGGVEVWKGGRISGWNVELVAGEQQVGADCSSLPSLLKHSAGTFLAAHTYLFL